MRVTLRPNYRTAGPDLGPRVRAFAAYLEGLDAQTCTDVAETLEQGMEVDIELDDGERFASSPEHVEIRREPAEGTAFAYEPPFGISLDLEITPKLRREGLVREFVHQAQIVRREAGLEVTDRITVAVAGPDDALAALREHTDYVARGAPRSVGRSRREPAFRRTRDHRRGVRADGSPSRSPSRCRRSRSRRSDVTGPGIVAAVSRVLFDLGCNVEDSSMTLLRGNFAMMLVLAMSRRPRRDGSRGGPASRL